MSLSSSPSKIRPSQNQFLTDICQVFRRHKVPSGHPADIEHLGSYLESNPAFRSDLFSLCTAISHMSEADLSPEALLDLVAQAMTGAHKSGSSVHIPEGVAASFHSLHQAWRDREDLDVAPTQDEAEGDAQTLPSLQAAFSRAASMSTANGDSSPWSRKKGQKQSTPDPNNPLPPDTPIGSLTLSELKNYLEDIEQRVSRLQPYLDAVAKAPGLQETDRNRPFNSSEVGQVSALSPDGARSSNLLKAIEEDSPFLVPAARSTPGQALGTRSMQAQTVQVEPLGASTAITAQRESRRYSRVLVPLGASVFVAATVATFGYRSFVRPATAAPVVATASEQPLFSDRPDSPSSAKEQKPPAHSAAVPQVPRGAETAPKKPLLDTASIPARTTVTPAVIGSNSGIAATVRPVLAASNTPLPSPATPPNMNRGTTTSLPGALPPSPTVVPVPNHPPATTSSTPTEPPHVIEPYTQRNLAEPPKTSPTPTITASAAPIVRPDVPSATGLPTVVPDSNLAVSVPSTTMMTYAISTPSPSYPTFHRTYVDTSVLVQATIGKDGRVANAKAITGSVDLASAAVTATQKWRFRPYLMNGAPVQVVTNFRFVFKAQQ